MTIDEIFAKIATHMINGVSFHEQLANCYGFLCLDGYKACHEYHHLCEMLNYRELYNYYLCHYHKLIKLEDTKAPSVISANWYKYTSGEVDTSTKRTTVRDLLKNWIEWETSTKELLTTCYKELYEINEIVAAKKIFCYLEDVCEEIHYAEKKRIKLETIGYDINFMISEQQSIYEKYIDKTHCKIS